MATEENQSTSQLTSEISLVWGGKSVNDAQLAPYTERWFLFYLTCMARLSLSRVYGVLYTTRSGYTGLLEPTNPAGTTLRMASGAALVYRYLYLNDANMDIDCSLTGYYRLVVRAALPVKEVRAVLLGPSTNGWPQITRDSNFNDITIARVYSNGATLTVYDDRRFFRNIVMPAYSSDASDWGVPSATPKRIRGTMVECGSYVPDTSAPIGIMPRRYPNVPVVIMGAYGDNPGVGDATKLVNMNVNTDSDFYAVVDAVGGIDYVHFISFGMRR